MTVTERPFLTPLTSTRPVSPWPTRHGLGQLPAAGPFGPTVRRLRLERGMSLRDLAFRTGLAVSSLSDLEGGISPDPRWSVVTTLARVFGVTVSELTAGVGE